MAEAQERQAFSRLAEALLVEIGKLDKSPQSIQKKQEPVKKTKEPVHTPEHNSFQHDPAVSAPLLSMLVDVLKKDNTGKEKLETIADEAEKKVDAVVALAERIKQMYANEMMQQAYAQTQSTYNPMQHYAKPGAIKLPGSSELQATEGYDEAKKLEPKAIGDENSTGYRISRGDKYQAFIMTDPKGRIHSTWNIVRVMNETGDGKLERNDGYISQSLS